MWRSASRSLAVFAASAAFAASLHISVETHRYLAHSYSIVGQQLALHLHQLTQHGVSHIHGLPWTTSEIVVTMHEAPVYNELWRNVTDMYPPGVLHDLSEIRATPAHSCPDVVMLQLQLLEVQMPYINAFKGL